MDQIWLSEFCLSREFPICSKNLEIIDQQTHYEKLIFGNVNKVRFVRRRKRFLGCYLMCCAQDDMHHGYIGNLLRGKDVLLHKVAFSWPVDIGVPTGNKQYFRPRLHRLNLQILLIHFFELLERVIDFFFGGKTREGEACVGPR